MPTNFLSLPSEVRNDIYEQLLVLEDPITSLTPGLLLANKTVHREASSLLYAQNRFDFTRCNFEHVALFLEQIGRNNANYIRHIYVDFPEFHYLDLQDVTLEDDSIHILEKIQGHCNKLSTITTSIHSTNAMELRLDALDCPKVVTEAMALVNTHFRAISSLQEIIVEVYEDGPSDHIRREMKSHGWTISATEYVEESGSDRSFGDIEDYDYGYDDADYDDDDYDIDNDSDFWRRAGD
ncbi:hypothetical protein K469DRAFT_579299 [Zopfia rhizophila CBS 207.26]|uniref:Uncharacterized protein n=1 Tax=Zopfia rhizophila CBS 207.26 TaxID=1314779 RepID=A0A6A6E1E2_9PEZI|nr:hypothetical protein K469DRAFT_579299 [Zopfia rhizophila CBS 207.26]